MCQCQRQQSIIEGLINDIKDLTSKNAEMTIRFKILQMENDDLKKRLEKLESCKNN
ncbi:hypothetical protein ABG79_02360 [Caloramator mitchellensis]|uniref:Uncharacterized protein n=1 Tax=Caloramator mitchellensis TaxID=908809 RepID=A0A0R3JQW8_CALMK|nr:hypothetical protein [Caloramator mitchellensis]KRQ85846.1 hypothetical protein ABG79_02360 [Caloramator mitchellensis]